ncbi:MAG: hypothetical protein IJY08_01165 [Clostridia bacterium]|nr:hypothetical protein [Clostridia bacterium]
MKILISCPRGRTFDSFFTSENIRLAESLGEVVYNPYARNMTSSEAAELMAGCQAYVTCWGAPMLDTEMLETAPTLRLLTHLGGTPQPFMSREAWRAGIKVISGQAYYSASVAEGVVAYILSALRNIPEYSYRLKYNREWKHAWDTNRGLVGKKVGIVNYNDISAALAKYLTVFGVELYISDDRVIPNRECARLRMTQIPMNNIFRDCDIICVQTPVSEQDGYMIDHEQLCLIRDGALLVNTSRGGIIRQSALINALSVGRFGAVLDVFEREPLSEAFCVEEDLAMFSLPNVILMPHMAGPTGDLRRIIARELLLESYEYIHNGIRPPHTVKRSKT